MSNNKLEPAFQFSGKKILVTGATGYVGRALTARLANEDCTLGLISRDVRELSVPKRATAKIEKFSIPTIHDQLSEITKHADIVFHLSAQTSLRYAELWPDVDRQANVDAMENLIAAMKQTGNPDSRIIFASTVTVVGLPSQLLVNEQIPDDPITTYDRHKKDAELLLSEAVERGQIQGCSLRLSNVYGYGVPSKNPERGVLNLMMRRAAAGEEPTIYGDGAYVRDFTHIDDVVEAFCTGALSSDACDGRYFVIAKGEGHTIANTFSMIANEASRLLDRNIGVRYVSEPEDFHPIERRNQVGDSSLFHSLTGWSAKWSLAQGVQFEMPKFLTEQRLSETSNRRG